MIISWLLFSFCLLPGADTFDIDLNAQKQPYSLVEFDSVSGIPQQQSISMLVKCIIDIFKSEFTTKLWTCVDTQYVLKCDISTLQWPQVQVYAGFHLLPTWNQKTTNCRIFHLIFNQDFMDLTTCILYIEIHLSSSKDQNRSLFLSLGEALSVRSSAWGSSWSREAKCTQITRTPKG